MHAFRGDRNADIFEVFNPANLEIEKVHGTVDDPLQIDFIVPNPQLMPEFELPGIHSDASAKDLAEDRNRLVNFIHRYVEVSHGADAIAALGRQQNAVLL